MDSKAEQNRYQIWIILHIFASLIALLIARSGGVGVKDLIFAVMTGSFLSAPFFAWIAMDTINSKLVSVKNRYGSFLKKMCWIGLIFLTLLSLLFIANSFFGIGIG